MEKILVYLGLVTDREAAEAAAAGVAQRLKCCTYSAIDNELFRVLAWYRVRGLHTITNPRGAGAGDARKIRAGAWLSENWDRIHGEAKSQEMGSHPPATQHQGPERSSSANSAGSASPPPSLPIPYTFGGKGGAAPRDTEGGHSPMGSGRDFAVDPICNRRYDKTVRAIRGNETLWVVNRRGGHVEPC